MSNLLKDRKVQEENKLWPVLKEWGPRCLIVAMMAWIVTDYFEDKKRDAEPASEPIAMPPLTEEVFLTEEGATDEEKQLVSGHADLRTIIERISDQETKIAALTRAINSGTSGDGVSEDRVKQLARWQIEYYKRNEDALAKKRGWRNYLTWDDIVNYQR